MRKGTRATSTAAAQALGLGAAIVVLGYLSIRVTSLGTEVAAWWPASGLALAVGLRGGRRRLPLVVAITGVASVLANFAGGRDPELALAFAVGNALEILVAGSAILAWNPTRRLAGFRDLVVTVAGAALGAITAGAIAGLALWWLHSGDLWTPLRAVGASHFSASLLFLPFCLRYPELRRPTSRAEIAASAVTLTAATLVVFAPGQTLPLVFLLFPLLVVTGMRQPLRANAVHMMLMSLTAIAADAAGWGPLVAAVQNAGMSKEGAGAIFQIFIAASALMVFALHITVVSREQALVETTRARRRLQAVIDSAPSTAIVQTSLDGVIEVFNQGAANILGYREDEVVGRHTPTLFHDPAEVARLAAELGIEPGFEVLVHAVRDGSVPSERRDWSFIAADGTRRVLSLTVSRVDDADGNPIGFLGIGEDVGAQRQAEQLLVVALEHERDLGERLRAADALKSEFVSSVSHELRTPMTSVLGYAEVLADEFGAALDEEGLAIVHRIQSSGRRLLALVDDLLALSRLETGTLSIADRPFDLSEVVRNAGAVMRPLAEDRDVHLDLRLPDDRVTVRGDAAEMERVVINLLSNAVKFSDLGRTVTAAVSSPEPGRVALVVSDTGTGIPAEDLGQIFTKFHRAANATESEAQGTGLGLAIVKGIVERHGGTVTVDSAVGAGSTFTVTLPAGEADGAPAPHEQAAATSPEQHAQQP